MFGLSIVRTNHYRWLEKFVEECIKNGEPYARMIRRQDMVIRELLFQLDYSKRKHPDLIDDLSEVHKEKQYVI